MKSKNIFDHFSSITDFRQSGKIKHPLVNIVTITLCATLCGADDWDAIEDYGYAKFEWLSSFFDMSSGVPSHDTISRVFSLLDPTEFQDKFILWVQNVIKKLDTNLVDNIQPQGNRTTIPQYQHSINAVNNPYPIQRLISYF